VKVVSGWLPDACRRMHAPAFCIGAGSDVDKLPPTHPGFPAAYQHTHQHPRIDPPPPHPLKFAALPE